MEQLPYFNKITLEEILGKTGENLNYWVKTRLKKGEIIVLKKGLYVAKSYLAGFERLPQARELYFEYLANIIRYPSYLSLEYVLSKYGLIPEGVFALTSITLKSSRKYQNKLGNFFYKNIKSELFDGFDYFEFEGKRVKIATKAKALFDFLYLKKFKDKEQLRAELLDGLRINWDEFSAGDRREFKRFAGIAGSAKMKEIIKTLRW